MKKLLFGFALAGALVACQNTRHHSASPAGGPEAGCATACATACDTDASCDEAAMADLRGRWPGARFIEDPAALAPWADAAFGREKSEVPLFLIGAPFQIKVWEALMRIPSGHVTSYSELAQAISAGFSAEARPPAELQDHLDRGQLGEAILRAMKLFHRGAAGNFGDLSAALATFRAVGLEDTARRAALQLMLLERG